MKNTRNNRLPAEAKHTALPWRVYDKLGDFEIAIVINRKTAPVTETLVQFHAHPNARADAAFIVRACNNYYQLLAAAKNALDYLPRQEQLQVAAIIADAQTD